MYVLRALKLSILVLIGLTYSSSALAQCLDLKIAYSAIWAPVTYDLKAKKRLGIGLDLQREIFKQLRQKVSFQSGIPWSRQLRMLQAGEIDAIVAMHQNPEREKVYLYSEPYHMSVVHVFARKDRKLAIKSLDDLKDLKGLTTTSASYGKEFDQFAEKNLHLTRFREPDRLVDLLISQRFDYMILPKEIGQYFIHKRSDVKEIEITGPEVASNPIHFVMSKKSQCLDLLPKFNEALAEMKENGRVKRIIARNLELAFGD